MTGPGRIEWRRGAPRQALRRVAWWAVVGAIVFGVALLLFGPEPATLDDGSHNVLDDVPLWTGLLVLATLAVVAVPLLRRPAVAADHYALRVRPGPWRTLLLPWAGISEVVAISSNGIEYLLIRLDQRFAGDRPKAWDQLVLKNARKGMEQAASYDLAVNLREFAGPPAGKVAALAAYAPETVTLEERL
ncbi:hypothetical protein Val02_81350 [Virgisporangium aliadipatigenens]|uniref:PH domain-containing protein n=1 Tax=Virgisporangium aliadipatigenens TaxID=741659 RepID=A0A8J4DUX5_9ACTN|nr:hypothetical protein Val02_81350 [Virgisporangium aliadipatigenens]